MVTVAKRPLLAESGPSILWILGHLNVRLREKRTLGLRLPKWGRKASALPSEADIGLRLVVMTANDPKRTCTDLADNRSILR